MRSNLEVIQAVNKGAGIRYLKRYSFHEGETRENEAMQISRLPEFEDRPFLDRAEWDRTRATLAFFVIWLEHNRRNPDLPLLIFRTVQAVPCALVNTSKTFCPPQESAVGSSCMERRPHSVSLVIGSVGMRHESNDGAASGVELA
jgi:hypothetical protein